MTMASQTARLNDREGIPFDLDYTDSFALGLHPEPKEYLAVIACHGIGVNNRGWEPLSKITPQGIRFLAYNQRGYEGSSPRTEGRESGNLDVGSTQVEDLLAFIRFSIDELGAGQISPGKKEPGIVILGWSKGATLCLGLMKAIQDDSADWSFLKSYLRRVVLFEPPGSIFGAKVPPLDVSSMSNWISFLRDDFPGSGQERWDPPREVIEQLERSSQLENVFYTLSWRIALSPEEMKELAIRLLTTRWDEKGLPSPLVGMIYGEKTNSYMGESAEFVKELWSGIDDVRRKGDIRKVPGNHCAFVEYPGEFWRALIEIIQSRLY